MPDLDPIAIVAIGLLIAKEFSNRASNREQHAMEIEAARREVMAARSRETETMVACHKVIQAAAQEILTKEEH